MTTIRHRHMHKRGGGGRGEGRGGRGEGGEGEEEEREEEEGEEKEEGGKGEEKEEGGRGGGRGEECTLPYLFSLSHFFVVINEESYKKILDRELCGVRVSKPSKYLNEVMEISLKKVLT